MKSNRILSTLFSILLATSAAVAGNPAADNTKASKIIIPKVEFRQATVDEGLAYLRVMSRKLDPDKSGVTIILVASEKTKGVKFDLDLVNVSLVDAVKSLAIAAGLEMTRDGEAIVLKSR
jgi:hypothetical protein